MTKPQKDTSSFWRLTESLVGRVVCIVFFLLVIPFFLFTLFQYQEDIQINKEEALSQIELAYSQINGSLQRNISEKHLLLDLLDLFPSSIDHLSSLTSLLGGNGLIEIGKVPSPHGYHCRSFSDSSYQKIDYSSLVERGLKGEIFGYFLQNDQFFIFRKSRKRDTFWALFLYPEKLMREWGLILPSVFDIETSLVDQKGKVLITTDPQFHKHGKNGKAPSPKNGEPLIYRTYPIQRSSLSLSLSSPDEIMLTASFHFYRKLMIAGILIILFGLLGTLIISYYLSHPFKKLRFVMQQVGKGNFSLRFEPTFLGFEVNTLGKIFNKVVTNLVKRIEEVKRERIKKETLARELAIGREVQLTIIPKELPSFPEIELAASLSSAKEVGGDFYDLLPRNSLHREEIAITVADTSGKGIYACLYSLAIRSILRTCSFLYSDLKEILQQANTLFCMDTGDSGVFVTIWMGIFNQKTNIMTFASCGHHPALLRKKDGSIRKLSTNGIALGVQTAISITTESVQLEKGDLFLLFTDGVIEACNEKMEMFQEKKVLSLLQQSSSRSPKELVDELIRQVKQFSGKEVQDDDLTIFSLSLRETDRSTNRKG